MDLFREQDLYTWWWKKTQFPKLCYEKVKSKGIDQSFLHTIVRKM
jgi:hypothetical protein